ncbi:MAG TPA: polysaccharide deacetylase family protein [Chlamydiales bacterium]|nr:polysaccharide deacetylase family protein [Chlamydiales bacterium]HPE85086.1 polysaccharide deacetylase family protein [Chlamydiales bacterium]
MIYTLLYHHAPSKEFFEEQLKHIASKYQPVHPGEEPLKGKDGVCLTFDDAYADFPKAFALIEKYGLKATLGIPTDLVGTPKYMNWDEIKNLAQSPLLTLASHSHTHSNLAEACDLELEIIHSKQILEAIKPINTFIFPYGKTSPESIDLAQKHYTYLMRIGTAANASWKDPLIYRIPADHLALPKEPFALLNRLRYQAKRQLNLLRHR